MPHRMPISWQFALSHYLREDITGQFHSSFYWLQACYLASAIPLYHQDPASSYGVVHSVLFKDDQALLKIKLTMTSSGGADTLLTPSTGNITIAIMQEKHCVGTAICIHLNFGLYVSLRLYVQLHFTSHVPCIVFHLIIKVQSRVINLSCCFQ